MKPFTQFINTLFNEIASQLPAFENPEIDKIRRNALEIFVQKELPSKQIEAWRHHPIDRLVREKYALQLHPDQYRPVSEYFKCCKIKDNDAHLLAILNGWYVHQDMPLKLLPNGVIVGSIMAALEQYPHLVFPYLARQPLQTSDSLIALNEALFNDGVFIYIPENVSIEKPVQIISLVDNKEDLLIQNRNLIVLGKNASLSLIQCDETITHGKTFINNVTEIFLAENAHLSYYKMENKDIDSLLVNNVFVEQESYSTFQSNITTFNAGYVRNNLTVDLAAPFADAKLYGVYLVDKKQYVDNSVVVKHSSPDCTSHQLYKGIADDEAQANFNGHIMVCPDAQRTEAFQVNKNITLTDEAKIFTKPFLEIYADDVKCSHGASVGQLDDDAMFYLRSRGICERNARMLLMYAFANEVVNLVKIDNLREMLNDMIQKRLSGELHACDQCNLHCSDDVLPFDIDIVLDEDPVKKA